MAAITFNATARKMWLRQQLKTMVFACHEIFDAFASKRMQHAAEAEQARLRRRSSHPNSPADQSETVVVHFGPLDPNVLSETIPAFFIGRNKSGLWVAREAKGRIGGIFFLKNSALSFAHAQTGAVGCATIFPSERFELDLENNGNPFATRLVPLMQFATDFSRQVGRIGGAIMGAARRFRTL
jgi:hypothetical protein